MAYITQELLSNPESRKTAEIIQSEIASRLPRSAARREENIAYTAWLLFRAAASGFSHRELPWWYIEDGDLKLQEDALHALKRFMDKEVWEKVRTLLPKYSAEEFALAFYLLEPAADYISGNVAPPDSLIRLAQDVLAVKPGEHVADLRCVYGTFLTAAALQEPDAVYTGYVNELNSACITRLRAELVGTEIQICGLSSSAEDEEKFDKLFSACPFVLKESNLRTENIFPDGLPDDVPMSFRSASADWYVNLRQMQLLKGDGKAVMLMKSGSTWNSSDVEIRRYFVEHGLLEAVIELPTRMFSVRSGACTMLVLSHGNRQIRLVDASQIFRPGRRINEFGEEEIDGILKALHTDSDCSRTVSMGELASGKFKLKPALYLNQTDQADHTVEFGQVIRRITRGAPSTAKQLDEMTASGKTDIHYLNTASIQDGLIDEDLPCLNTVPKGYERYFVENNNLIISKNGYPVKLAIASVKPGEKIIACGNLYIIELDEKRVNPWFLKAFFESEEGDNLLKRISVGSNIPVISLDGLRESRIPLPPLEEQNQIAARYQAAMREITEYRTRLKEAIEQARHIYDSKS